MAVEDQMTPSSPIVVVTREQAAQELLRTVMVSAENASMNKSGAEAKDYAQAALAAAQALTVLDPVVDVAGVPLDHQLQVEQLRGEQALEQARQRAAAPTPAKSLNRSSQEA